MSRFQLSPGYKHVNKFGRAPDGVQTTITDIWDLANATPTQSVYVAPTVARVHAVDSSSTSDAAAGVGARTVRLFGLTSWDTEEVTEDITMNGTTDVNTANSYVFIHRMEVLTSGATSINVGTLAATAATDSSISAHVRAGEGQTQMALYAWPSTRTAHLTCYYSSLNESAGAATAANVTVKYNSQPDSQELNVNFRTIHTQSVTKTGTSYFSHPFDPYLELPGPGILKIQCIGSAADLDVSAGFDLILKSTHAVGS